MWKLKDGEASTTMQAVELKSEDAKSASQMRLQPPGKGGTRLPAGRAKGTPNRVTVTVKQAIEQAIQPGGCHPEGLAGWLIERAKGNLGDRQIFASVVNKFVPLQVQAQVNGGIKIELGWLGGRQIGTGTAQLEQAQPQVIEMQQESEGVYRIVDPQEGVQGGGQPSQVLEPSAISDPHPPQKPGAGG